MNTENLVVVDVDDWREESIPYKQEVLKNPYVESIAIGVDLSDFLQGYRWETSKFSWQDGASSSSWVVESSAACEIRWPFVSFTPK